MSTLYELTAELAALDAWLDEMGGDVTGCEEDFDRAYLDAEGALESKIDGYCALIAEIESRAAARKAEAGRLAELARHDERKATRLKSTLLECLKARDTRRVDTFRFLVKVVKNGGRQAVEIDRDVDAASLPEEFRLVRVDVSKQAVYDALTAGQSLPFARLLERGEHLRIT